MHSPLAYDHYGAEIHPLLPPKLKHHLPRAPCLSPAWTNHFRVPTQVLSIHKRAIPPLSVVRSQGRHPAHELVIVNQQRFRNPTSIVSRGLSPNRPHAASRSRSCLNTSSYRWRFILIQLVPMRGVLFQAVGNNFHGEGVTCSLFCKSSQWSQLLFRRYPFVPTPVRYGCESFSKLPPGESFSVLIFTVCPSILPPGQSRLIAISVKTHIPAPSPKGRHVSSFPRTAFLPRIRFRKRKSTRSSRRFFPSNCDRIRSCHLPLPCFVVCHYVAFKPRENSFITDFFPLPLR